MSTSSPSPSLSLSSKPMQQERDVVFEETLILETQNQPYPEPKSDPPPHSLLDPQQNIQEKEDAEKEQETHADVTLTSPSKYPCPRTGEEEQGEDLEEGQEHETSAISSGMSLPPITDHCMSVADVPRRSGQKRKKGKGKGKSNVKSQQAIEEKLQTLMKNLNPIPFIPHRILDFAKHEKLLKKLKLWDFVHIDFDREIRADLIAQLVATYKENVRASYVNDCRVMVNRADLARALKLPFKKEKGNNAGGVDMDSDSEVLSDDSIGFLDEFVSDWVLLHEDMWVMPDEVLDWLKMIKEGRAEKVDWPGLFWFMVKKELKQGVQLKDCYYASHLQHLIKFQHEDAFLVSEPAAEAETETEAVELDAKSQQEEDVKENDGISGPSTELTLGQDGEKDEETKDVEMKDGEKDNDNHEEEEERGLEEEQGQWLLQPCGVENTMEFDSYEERKDEEEDEEEEEEMDQEEQEEEEEEGDKFHVFPTDDAIVGDGFAGNLLQPMEENQMGFSSAPSFFNNTGKRVIEHDDHHIEHNNNNNTKRLRINEPWGNKAMDVGTIMENIKQMAEQAKFLHEEKDQALEESNINQQILLNELQKRDNVIEHLQKTKMEEIQKRDAQIYRLDRELCLMATVLDGYKKALKDTNKAFIEYRKKAKLSEEPTYKDVGPGGLMLSTAEIERLRKKQEEEFKMNCVYMEQNLKEAEESYAGEFQRYLEKINHLDKKLTGLEVNAKELTELHAKGKGLKTEGDERIPVEEKVPECDEPVPVEEKMDEGDEPVPVDEKMDEGDEPVPVEEKVTEEVAEVAEDLI